MNFRFAFPRFLLTSLCVLGALSIFSACEQNLKMAECADDLDCDEGAICELGSCTLLPEEVNLGCTEDLDCDVNNGFTCDRGACIQAGPQACGTTASCPFDQYCNSATSTCTDLLEGWCRQEDQCESGLCSSSGAVPGRCVQCRNDEHCENGATCNLNNLCEGGTAPQPECQPNASDNNGVCRCDNGFEDDGTGNCVLPEVTPPTCPQNARIQDGSCVCNNGFEPGDGGTCVPTSNDVTGPGGGGSEPDAEDDVCAEFGWYNDGECDTFCPSPDPDCGEVTPEPEVADECTINQDCWSTNPNTLCSAGACVCDADFLSQNCSGGFDVNSCSCTAGPRLPGQNESCITDNTVLQCAAGLDCLYEVDSFNDPLFGSCKKVCQNNDNECVGGECIDNYIRLGFGICGQAFEEGESGCGGYWTDTNDICFDGTNSDSDEALLTCLEGSCQRLCDLGTLPRALECPANRTCGSLGPMNGFDTTVAVCTP